MNGDCVGCSDVWGGGSGGRSFLGGTLLAHNLAELEPHSSSRLTCLSVNGLK